MTGRRRLKRKGQWPLNMDIMIERNISTMEMQEGRDVMSQLVHLQSSHLQDTHLMRRTQCRRLTTCFAHLLLAAASGRRVTKPSGTKRLPLGAGLASLLKGILGGRTH